VYSNELSVLGLPLRTIRAQVYHLVIVDGCAERMSGVVRCCRGDLERSVGASACADSPHRLVVLDGEFFELYADSGRLSMQPERLMGVLMQPLT
jgi:hypothetical protein